MPLIHALEKCNDAKRKEMTKLLKIKRKRKSQINKLIDFAIEYDGLEYATLKMQEYSIKAKDILSHFPDNDAKTSITTMIDYIMSRKN